MFNCLTAQGTNKYLYRFFFIFGSLYREPEGKIKNSGYQNWSLPRSTDWARLKTFLLNKRRNPKAFTNFDFSQQFWFVLFQTMSCKVQQTQTQANGWDFASVQPHDLCKFKLICYFTVVWSQLIRAWWVNEDGRFLFLFRQLFNTYYRMKLLMEVLGSPDKLVVSKWRQRYTTTELRASRGATACQRGTSHGRPYSPKQIKEQGWVTAF